MKNIMFLLLLLSWFVPAQDPKPVAGSPIVIYWKTLTPEEKEVFLFSYLTQVYDTYTAMKKELGYNEVTQWYYQHKAELVFGVFEPLETAKMSELVGWIDEYYRHDEFMDKPFNDALDFAFRFQEAAGESLWEKYENLNRGEINP
ncbi:MAG: hypothetical protein ACE5D8_08855 [Fidelibacterota bacterium]